MEKAIDLSLKAIKVTVEPYVGQTCITWFRGYDFFFILLFQYVSTRVNIITPLGKLSGNIKNSLFNFFRDPWCLRSPKIISLSSILPQSITKGSWAF